MKYEQYFYNLSYKLQFIVWIKSGCCVFYLLLLSQMAFIFISTTYLCSNLSWSCRTNNQVCWNEHMLQSLWYLVSPHKCICVLFSACKLGYLLIYVLIWSVCKCKWSQPRTDLSNNNVWITYSLFSVLLRVPRKVSPRMTWTHILPHVLRRCTIT